MRIDMRQVAMLQNPDLRQLNSTTNDVTASTVEQDPFSQVFDSELAKHQVVITADQLKVELNGSYEHNNSTTKLRSDVRVLMDQTSNRVSYEDESVSDTKHLPIMQKISKIANDYGVDQDLVTEVIRAESNFNPRATSHAGAKGLMQLMDSTARMLKVQDSYNPDQNIKGGTKYLRDLLNKYDGNTKVALAAYNAGPGRLARLSIDTNEEFDRKSHLLPKETQNYVAKIMKRLQD